jgi:hypothetical protein
VLGALSRLADSAPETVSWLGRERGAPRVAAAALLAVALAAEALAVLVLGLLTFVALVQARRAAG